ncbi:Pycsar system effector family protein [Rhodococcus koreensis]|uniref:Pycsar system effector family protein n=1 Tax=Rhodococcus koreensis TaxID=99653 RepID=UPI00115FAE54|nr:Pycsar system effector family protein [Rhodococcus koreensis]
MTTGSDRGLDQERLDVMRDKARVDTAWEIQKALLDWNGRVDIRATFTLTIDTALIGAVIALSTDGGLFAGLGGASRVFNFVGVAFVFASALCAVAVVTPVLRRRSVLQSEARNHNKFIYYGHLRQLSDTEIHRYLELDGPAILGALSHELKYTGDNAWRKNRFTQLALLFTTVGSVLLFLSFQTTLWAYAVAVGLMVFFVFVLHPVRQDRIDDLKRYLLAPVPTRLRRNLAIRWGRFARWLWGPE